MWNSDQKTQDAPAKSGNTVRRALAESAGDLVPVDSQKRELGNKQVKWWALALPVLVIMVIIAAHFLNAPVATKAEHEKPLAGEPFLLQSSTSSKRARVRFPGKAFVSSIAYSQSRALAFINDEMVPEGAVVNGATVFKIHPDTVEFEKDGQRWTQKVGERPVSRRP